MRIAILSTIFALLFIGLQASAIISTVDLKSHPNYDNLDKKSIMDKITPVRENNLNSLKLSVKAHQDFEYGQWQFKASN